MLAISQSGESPDILAVVTDAKKQGSPTLAITNSPNSTLAKTADEVILLHAGEERSIAATKTFTASIGGIALFAAAWIGGGDKHLDELLTMPERIAEAIEVEPAVRALTTLATRYQPLRGHRARLQLRDGLRDRAQAEGAHYVGRRALLVADFLHGPIAMVDEKLHAIVVAPSGRAHDSSVEFVQRIRSEGGRLVAISDRTEFIGLADMGIRIPTVPSGSRRSLRWFRGSCCALHLARAKGYDVDRPRRLTKVTRTV